MESGKLYVPDCDVMTVMISVPVVECHLVDPSMLKTLESHGRSLKTNRICS